MRHISQDQNHKRWWIRYGLVAALITGVALRLISMIQTDFGYDEIMQARVSLVDFSGVAAIAKSHYGASPLDYYLCWISCHIFSTDTSLRFPAFLWGILSIFAAYRAGRRWGGRTEALIAAWMIALSPMLIFSSHLVRWYSGLVFFTLAIPVTGDYFLKKTSKKNAIYYSFAVCMGLLIHLFVIFSLASYLVSLLLSHLYLRMSGKKIIIPFRKIINIFILTFLASLPYAGWAIYAGVGKGSPFKPPDFGLELFGDPFYHFSGGISWLMPVLFILTIGGLIILYRRKTRSGLFFTLLLLSWPFLILVSIERSYIFCSRHIIYILPWILVAAGFGLAFASRKIHKIIPTLSSRWIAGILLFLYALPQLNRAHELEWGFGEPVPLKIVTRIIRQNMEPETYFILPPRLYNPLEWYANRYEGLKDRIWETNGPEGGANNLVFPLRVMWLSDYPSSVWIKGGGFRYENIYVFYETYTRPEALGSRLLDFGFESFVLSDASSHFYLQDLMRQLANRWEQDINEWFSDGLKSHEEFIESNALTARAQPLLRNKQFDKAVEMLEKAVEINPYNVRAQAGLAFAALGKDNPVKSIKLWYKVLNLCPNFYEAYWNLAQIHRRLGQKELSLKAIERAARFPEASPAVFKLYENLLRESGYPEKAEAVIIQKQIMIKNYEPYE